MNEQEEFIDDDSDAAIRRRVEKRLKMRGEFLGHELAFAIINVIAWALWYSGLDFGWQFPWPLIVSLAWGSGILSHAAETFYRPFARPQAVQRAVAREMEQLHGADWQHSASEEQYHGTYQKVYKRFDTRSDFATHLAAFVPLNVLAWLLWIGGVTIGLGGWPLIFTGLWGLGLAIHGIQVFYTASEGLLRREIEREMAQYSDDVKLKRKRKNVEERVVSLSDDGELVEMELDESERQERRRGG